MKKKGQRYYLIKCFYFQSKFVTNRGNINLRNIHNESYIASYECGDVKVKGIDGSTNGT